jgi:hypothetical protein
MVLLSGQFIARGGCSGGVVSQTGFGPAACTGRRSNLTAAAKLKRSDSSCGSSRAGERQLKGLKFIELVSVLGALSPRNCCDEFARVRIDSALPAYFSIYPP